MENGCQSPWGRAFYPSWEFTPLWAMDGDRERPLVAGASQQISKPIKVKEWLARIEARRQPRTEAWVKSLIRRSLDKKGSS